MEFKVGDKVKLLESSNGSVNRVGDIGIIDEISDINYRVQVKGRPNYANNHPYRDLELYVEGSNYEIY